LNPPHTVRVSNSIEEIDKNSLDSISNDPLFTHAWLRTIETQQSYRFNPIYITVYQESRLVGFAPCYIETCKPRQFFTFLPEYINKINYTFRVLRCYSPFSGRTKVVIEKSLNEKLILHSIINKIDDLCKKQKILLSYFPYVSQFDKFLIEGAQHHQYMKHPEFTAYYLDAKWNSFEEYLESLKPKARRNILREIKKCQENGFVIKRSEIGKRSVKLSELYSNLSAKYQSTTNIFNKNFFDKLNENAKEKTLLITANKHDEIVGFSLSFHQREFLDVMFVGFNYDFHTKTDFMYFNLCYYEPIKWAIEHGIRKVYYRTLADQAKASRGCKQETVFSLVKYHNQLMRAAMSSVLYPLYENKLSKTLISQIIKRR
jgi:uncharacterized protein